MLPAAGRQHDRWRRRLAGMLLLLVLLVFGLIGLPGCAPHAQEPSTANRIPLTDCQVRGYPSTARCGTYLVPENPQARFDRQVSINFVVLPALSRPSEPDPLFYFDGGPGAGAARAAGNIARFLSDVNQRRDLVFIDVRGTGRSGPLECVEPADGAPLQAHFEEFLSDDYVRRCLEAQTADVRFYTQPFAMDDVNAIREALGYQTINLFGSSGGTRQEQIYMKRHGASVRAVVMHGVQAMDGEMPLPFSRALEDGIRGLLDACAADATCHSSYPDLRGDWDAVRKRFDAGPVNATIRDQRTGRTERVTISRGVYADGLRHMLYVLDAARTVPAEINRAGRGDFAPFAERELAQARRFADVLSHAMFITSTCAEDIRFIDDADILRATSGTFLGDYRVRRQQAACRIWPRGEGIDADFQKAVTLDVPVLIISGEFDVATPPSEAERVARALPRARHVIFPNQAHDYTNPACASRLIAEFIASADVTALDLTCVATTTRPAFGR